MHISPFRNKLFAVATALASLFASGWAYADPPLRAARLGYTEGQVSFSAAGDSNWVQSVVNRPLTTGDRLWVDGRSKAELQIGGSSIRLGENTSVTLLNVGDNITQVQLTQGTLKLHVRRIDPNQILEVDTPNLALTMRKPGDYRLDVNPNGGATEVNVQGNGEAEVYGDGASYAVRAGQGYRFFGTGLSDYENVTTRYEDDLDRWARERERRIAASVSVRYVSSELVGYEDLDANGIWRVDPTYGNVWSPSRVVAGWAPYHDGHWAWVNPWGWTWVDAAPWGYAVSHYGRWAHIGGAWAWVPGPVQERAVYAPALVVFLGGAQFQGGTVGWFPLAPREVYQPTYRVSHGYFDYINRSNAVIAPATITNIYNTHVTNITNVTNVINVTNAPRINYVNRDVTGAVVAVPMQAFAQSQSVARVAVSLQRDAAMHAAVAQMAAVMPVVQSVRGGAPEASVRPPESDRRVIARTAPPTQPIAFVSQQPQPAGKAAASVDDLRRVAPKPVVAMELAPQVRVVNSTAAPVVNGAAPAVAPHHLKPEDERRPEIAKIFVPVAPAPGLAIPAITEKAKVDATREAAAREQSDRARVVRDETAKTDMARMEAARSAATKADAEKSRADRDDAVKVNAARQETARQEVARQQEAAKADVARAQAEHAKAARDEAMLRDRTAKEDATRSAAAHAQMEKVRASREQDAARAQMARVEAPRPVTAPPSPQAPAQARPELRRERAAQPGEKKDKAEDGSNKR